MAASTRQTLDALRRGDLAGARELRLPGALGGFPEEIFGLADSLEVLDLSGGGLTDLPADLARLSKLRVLFCSGNRFERLPPALGACPALSQIGCRGSDLREIPGEALPSRLRWLTLTDNRIEALPDALGERSLLQKLMLAGNRLETLPSALAGAQNLELIRLSANRFDALPLWLAALPRLAWISWAGNPCEPQTPPVATARVPWTSLERDALLGEGASGRVYRALWHRDGAARAVALKLFKGVMTSDGLPEREMAACLAAGEHRHLTGGLGRLVDHPDDAQGLIMRLLPKAWRVLAGPPSLSSCSRDVYAPDLRLAPSSALRIAEGVASALAHLHARGLLHGDVYAHNVLWEGTVGEAVLSDFGAAASLPSGAEGEVWQRIEVRAWGLLLGELLDLCESEPEAIAELRQLRNACVQSHPKERPLMVDAVQAMAANRGRAE